MSLPPSQIHPSVAQPLARTANGASRLRWVPAFAGTTIVVLASALAVAQQPLNADPALEARVKALSAELRCLVCQNQTVADSDAPVARDMRDQVRTQLAAGKSEAEVKQYMTDRFGDFVLYKPPLKATTVVLWLGPFAALLAAAWLLTRRLRRAAPVTATPLSEADRERARALLQGDRQP